MMPASAARSTAGLPRKGPRRTLASMESRSSSTSSSESGATAKATSCSASVKMPPSPNMTTGPKSRSRIRPDDELALALHHVLHEHAVQGDARRRGPRLQRAVALADLGLVGHAQQHQAGVGLVLHPGGRALHHHRVAQTRRRRARPRRPSAP